MNEQEIFQTAIGIADSAQRQDYLAQACASDAALRGRVELLLAAHAAASGESAPAPASPPTLFGYQPTIELPKPPESSGTSPAQNADGDDPDETQNVVDLNFLQPSSKPGSMGKLAHYEFLQVLGQGAFGIVFKAFDEKLHRHVAIKTMNPQLAATSPPRKRFLREARSAAAIKHENVVQVYSVEEHPLPYLVMEYVDGQTLQQKLNGVGPLEVAEILYLGRQMAAGLAAAHDKGLIHRDIKPGNILIESGAEQKVKITDFGLARAADDATMTRTGMIAGTPMYMAPEQAQGQTLDHRADLFSLGSVLYQMACGRPPFRGSTTLAVLKRVTDEPARPIKEILAEVPDWLCAIIEKLHAKNPAERFQTAKELAELFARCQSELQLNGKVTLLDAGKVQPAVPQNVLSPAPASRRESSTTGSRLPRIVAAAALLVLAGLTMTELTGITSLVRSPANNGQPVKDEGAPVSGPGQTTPVADSITRQPPPADAPFTAAQARAHQEAWAKYLGTKVETDGPLGIKMVLIPPGTFMMGATQAEIDEIINAIKPEDREKSANQIAELKSSVPQHKVKLTRAYRVASIEVTVGQFRKFIDATDFKTDAERDGKGGYYIPGGVPTQSPEITWRNPGHEQTDECPVVQISWNDAVSFCNWLSRQEKLPPVYVDSNDDRNWRIVPGPGYRLPTEAEWEHACRAGTTTRYFTGDDPNSIRDYAWFDNTTGSVGYRSQPVASKLTNPFGLFDIQGNAREWVQDGNDDNYFANAGELSVDPPGASAGSSRVIRGGSWSNSDSYCRSQYRARIPPSFRSFHSGFRVARSEPSVLDASSTDVPAAPDAGWTLSSVPPSAATPPISNQARTDEGVHPTSADAVEREVAAWVLSIGGSLTVVKNGQQIKLIPGSKLPDPPFATHRIEIDNKPSVRDDDLKLLGRLTRLKELNVHYTVVSDQGVSHLSQIASLRSIQLDGTKVTDACVDSLLQLPNLDALYIGNTDISPQILPKLKHSPQLRHLKISSWPFDPIIARELRALPKLRSIGLNGSWITEAGVGELTEMQIWSIGIFDRISDERLRLMQRLPKLRDLYLMGDVHVSPIGLESLSDFPELTWFGSVSFPLTDGHLESLAKCERLERIDFGTSGPSTPSVTDEGLKHLERLPNLKFLQLFKTSVTPAGLAHFRAAKPNCAIQTDVK